MRMRWVAPSHGIRVTRCGRYPSELAFVDLGRSAKCSSAIQKAHSCNSAPRNGDEFPVPALDTRQRDVVAQVVLLEDITPLK